MATYRELQISLLKEGDGKSIAEFVRERVFEYLKKVRAREAA